MHKKNSKQIFNSTPADSAILPYLGLISWSAERIEPLPSRSDRQVTERREKYFIVIHK